MNIRTPGRLRPETRTACAVRRALDLTGAVVGLLVLGIPMLLIAALIRAGSTGPALYRQVRVGAGRRPFVMYKFRTMRVGGTDAAHRELLRREIDGESVAVGGSFKLSGDDRITGLGRFLRATSIDELPQLINVLRGDMSLVGPRPCLVWEATLFPAEFAPRFQVRPGLTGLWQVSGRSRLDTLQMLRLDVQYVAVRTLWTDVRILLATFPALLRDGGAR